VAKIEDRVVTLGEYEKAINSVSPEYLPSSMDLSGLLEFLDTMIDREVLALKADELGYDKDPMVIDGMETFRAVGLQGGYLQVKIRHKLAITDKDLEEVHDKYGLVYQVKQILTDTETEANEVHDLLTSGHDFESVCKEHSRGPDAAIGGKMVSAAFGQFPPHFQDELFSTEVGDVTQPIINQYGYFVIKVISKSQPPKRPFDEVAQHVRLIARQQKQLRATYELSMEIRKKHNFEFHDDNLKTILNAFPPDRDYMDPPNRDTEVYPLLDIALEDLDKPVATYDDQVLTVRDFSDLYDRAQFVQRPRREYRLGSIKKFLLDVVMNDLIEVELASSGIENEPEVAEMFDRKREELMVNRLYWDLIDQQTTVRWNEVEDFYKDNMEAFHSGERRRFNIILTPNKRSAEQARQRVNDGGSFERIAQDYASNEEIQETGINDVYLVAGDRPELDEAGFSLRDVGDISKPFEIQQGWVIAKLVAREPEGYRPITEVQQDINHRLKQEKNDERLDELLVKWREEYNIQIFENNLKKVEVKPRRTPSTRGGGR
jgi:peptidyl-prolyl cis-trans isomerase C